LESPGVVNKLDQAHYEQTDLEQLINEANNNEKKTIAKKASSTRFFAGVSIGRTITEVSEITIAGLPTNIVYDHAAISPRLNLGVDFFDNSNVQRFVFRSEMAFSYVNPKYAYQVNRVDGTIAHATYVFNQYTASIAPQILFNFFNKDDFKIYVDAGAAFNFSLYTNNKFAVEETSDTNPYTLAPFWLSFPLQTGMVLNKKIEVCLTYITKASYSRYSSFDANNQTVSLGVKFLFGKK